MDTYAEVCVDLAYENLTFSRDVDVEVSQTRSRAYQLVRLNKNVLSVH